MGEDNEGDQSPDGIAKTVELGEPEQEEADGEFGDGKHEDGLWMK